MKRSLSPVIQMLAVLAAIFGLASAQTVTTDATHAVIMDGDTGDILFSKGGNEPIPPASMSKLMTVAVVLDMIKRGELTPDTEFDVSAKAWRTGGSKMFVLVDTKIRVEDLLKGIITLSGNDAAVVVAENIAGDEASFAALMNQKAKEWGLKQSHFSNPHGMTDEGQRMSAADIAKLARHMWDEYPAYRYLYSIPEMTWSDITQANRNPLLAGFPGADGMKTGHTEEAGYGMVGSASKDGVRRVIVVTGLPSLQARARESVRMMEIAFNQYLTQTYYGPDDIVTELTVFGGKEELLPVKLGAAMTFTRHRKILEGAEARITYRDPIIAPVRTGEQVAVMRFTMPGEPVREYPLYAAATVEEKGVFAKMGMGLKILFTPPAESE
ncbi:D-alanyl-D-alanine carboxypeptidase family protein [Parvularcula marina]|uniref:D-alanyl-D-alanine carboxypeptidase family protein n=1 Tax=Parvularcula marina TaxID=2292771 RepID=UPI003519B375